MLRSMYEPTQFLTKFILKPGYLHILGPLSYKIRFFLQKQCIISSVTDVYIMPRLYLSRLATAHWSTAWFMVITASESMPPPRGPLCPDFSAVDTWPRHGRHDGLSIVNVHEKWTLFHYHILQKDKSARATQFRQNRFSETPLTLFLH